MKQTYTITKSQRNVLPKMMVFAYTSNDVSAPTFITLYELFNLGNITDKRSLSEEHSYENINDTYTNSDRIALNTIRKEYLKHINNE